MKEKNSAYKEHLRFNSCDFSVVFQEKVRSVLGGPAALFKDTGKLQLTDNQKRKLDDSMKVPVEEIEEKIRSQGADLISIDDEDYPEELRNIYGAPMLLYMKGDRSLLGKEMFAIVGSRKITAYGKAIASDFASKIAGSGFPVVSGLAAGADSSAHKGAMKTGSTVAVLATGIDLCYPAFNELLKKEIEAKGLVLTEFFPGTSAEPFRFPVRNRIISGLSRAVLVVEARRKSGSLITAKYAIDQGREVYAVPGDINRSASEGTNFLIKNAMAHMVTDLSDIEGVSSVKPPEQEITPEEETVGKLIDEGIDNFDDLLERTGMDFGRLSELLFSLEIKNKIVKISNNSYRGV